jgi:hypothetical protein
LNKPWWIRSAGDAQDVAVIPFEAIEISEHARGQLVNRLLTGRHRPLTLAPLLFDIGPVTMGTVDVRVGYKPERRFRNGYS